MASFFTRCSVKTCIWHLPSLRLALSAARTLKQSSSKQLRLPGKPSRQLGAKGKGGRGKNQSPLASVTLSPLPFTLSPSPFALYPFPNQIYSGRSITKRVPLPGSLSTLIVPSCCSTICLTMARPNPVPRFFVEKNGSNTRSSVALSMPLP